MCITSHSSSWGRSRQGSSSGAWGGWQQITPVRGSPPLRLGAAAANPPHFPIKKDQALAWIDALGGKAAEGFGTHSVPCGNVCQVLLGLDHVNPPADGQVFLED